MHLGHSTIIQGWIFNKVLGWFPRSDLVGQFLDQMRSFPTQHMDNGTHPHPHTHTHTHTHTHWNSKASHRSLHLLNNASPVFLALRTAKGPPTGHTAVARKPSRCVAQTCNVLIKDGNILSSSFKLPHLNVLLH